MQCVCIPEGEATECRMCGNSICMVWLGIVSNCFLQLSSAWVVDCSLCWFLCVNVAGLVLSFPFNTWWNEHSHSDMAHKVFTFAFSMKGDVFIS